MAASQNYLDQTSSPVTASANEVIQPDVRKKGLKIGQEIRIATWNVCGMVHESRKKHVVEQFNKHNIDILGISEHKCKGLEEECLRKGECLIWSGQKRGGQSGVAILLSKRMKGYFIDKSLYSDRVMTVRLRAEGQNISIIQVYAPICDKRIENHINFYHTLQSALDKCEKSDLKIIMGDFNSMVGSKPYDFENGIVGNHGFGDRNECGDRLVDFAIENNFVITNTTFDINKEYLHTWTSKRNKQKKNQIDFILVNKGWETSFEKVSTFPPANLNFGDDNKPFSDHELLAADIKLKRNITRLIQYDTPHNIPRIPLNIHYDYENAIKTGFKSLQVQVDAEEMEPDKLAEKIKAVFHQNEQPDSSGSKASSPESKVASKETLEAIHVHEREKERKTSGLTSQKYKKCSNRVQTPVMRDKKNAVSQQKKNAVIQQLSKIKELEMATKCTREIIQQINKVATESAPRVSVINDKKGKELTDSEKICQRWEEYYREMYDINDTSHRSLTPMEHKGKELEPPPTLEEVKKAIEQLPLGESAGNDEITGEMIKASGIKGVKIYHTLCEKIWQKEKWPLEWLKTVFVPIPKHDDLDLQKECKNYETTAHISHGSKILLKIIMTRLEEELGKETDEGAEETDEGTVEETDEEVDEKVNKIFIVRSLIENYREAKKGLHMCFIDYTKAFDYVNHQKMIETLKCLKCNSKIVNLILNLYKDQLAAVRLGDELTNWFPVKSGMRQGCILSPLMVRLLVGKVGALEPEEEYCAAEINGEKIVQQRYENEIVLFSETSEGLNKAVKQHSEDMGLQLNKEHMKIMHLDGRNISIIRIDGEELENVTNVIYLGALISANETVTSEIRRRLLIAKVILRKMLPSLLESHYIKRENVLKDIIIPSALKGCETWNIPKTVEKRVNFFNWTCYKKIYELVPEESIGNNREFGGLIRDIREKKLSYLKLVLNRENTLERRFMDDKFLRRRGRGRPQAHWLSDIQKAFTKDRRTEMTITASGRLEGSTLTKEEIRKEEEMRKK